VELGPGDKLDRLKMRDELLSERFVVNAKKHP